ncbi:MAG: DUF998 domain-containing protein [Promethearchaeota archaeon]
MQIEQKINKSLDFLFNLIPGGLFGIISMIIGLTGDFLAAVYYPGGYNIFIHQISNLGILELSPGRIFFNIGVIICGIMALPFNIYLGRFVKEEYGENQWIRIAVVANHISSFSLIFVGITLGISRVPEDIPFFLHGLFAGFCFLGASIYCAIYSCLFLKKRNKFSRNFAIFGFIVAIIELIIIFIWHPFIEWIANFSIISWIIIASSYTLYKRY